MSPSTTVKVFGLVVLAVCTSMVTKTMYGQSKGKARAASRAAAPADADTPGGAVFLNKEMPSGTPLPMALAYQLESFRAGALGNDVFVNAKVNMMDRRPGVELFWTLRVYSDDRPKKLIVEKHYDTFKYSPQTADGMMPVTFGDGLQLPRGVYTVSLILHAGTPGMDRAILSDSQKSLKYRGLWQNQKVVVE